MNTQNNPSLDEKLQALEAEVNQSSEPPSAKTSVEQDKSLSQQLQTIFAQIQAWFARLPHVGKVGVTLLTIVVSFSLLKTFLELVSALITLAVVGGLLYWVYVKAIAPSS